MSGHKEGAKKAHSRRILNEFEDAAIALSWAGSRSPAEREELQQQYDIAKAKIEIRLGLKGE